MSVVSLAAAVVLVLVAVAGLAVSNVLIGQERDQKDAALQEKEAALGEAKSREAETQAVLEFVENRIFAAARPEGQEGGLDYDMKLADAVKAALPYLDESFPNQPLIEARLRMTIGRSFWYLGKPAIAAEEYQAARTLYTRHRGSDHPDTLMSMNWLANSCAAAGRIQEALKLHEETLQLQKAKRGPDHLGTLNSMMNLAVSYHSVGRFADAIKLLEETVPLLKSKLGIGDQITLGCMTNLAVSYYAVGQAPKALQLEEETLQLKQAKLPPNHGFTAEVMKYLAWWLSTTADVQLRDPPRAVQLGLQTVKIKPLDWEAWCVLGAAHYRTGNIREAAEELEKVVQLHNLKDADKGTIDFSNAASNAFFLAMARWQLGATEKAREWYAKAVQWMEHGIKDYDEPKRIQKEAAELLGIGDKQD